MNGDPRSVLLAPVVSEKSYGMIARARQVHVPRASGRPQDRRSARPSSSVFEVDVLDVNVIKVPAKPKRRGMHARHRPGWKKAVVTVAAGQTIEAFDGGVGQWPFKFKPTSPGRRFMTVSDFDEITKSEPEKTLLAPLSKTGGRNNNGRITTRHQGGGHKRRYRIIDFKRTQGRRARPRCTRSSTTPTARRGSRCCTTPTARSATSWRRCGCGSARRSSRAPNVDIRPGQRAAAVVDPDRHHGARRRASPRPGRQDGALGRRLGAAGGQGGRHGAAAAAVRRDAARAGRRAGRPSGSSATSRTRSSRAARPGARAGRASARPCAAPS